MLPLEIILVKFVPIVLRLMHGLKDWWTYWYFFDDAYCVPINKDNKTWHDERMYLQYYYVFQVEQVISSEQDKGGVVFKASGSDWPEQNHTPWNDW